MRLLVLEIASVLALFGVFSAPAFAQERAVGVPASNGEVQNSPSSVPLGHVPAFATQADLSTSSEAPASWYGWQTLTADLASIGLISVGVANHNDALAFTGVGSLVLSPSVIHMAHGRFGSAGWSLAARAAGVPVAAGLGYAIGEATCSPSSRDRDVPCQAITANIGLLGAGIFAIVLDAAILSWKPAFEPDPPASARRRGAAAVSLVPSLSLGREQSTVTLRGEF